VKSCNAGTLELDRIHAFPFRAAEYGQIKKQLDKIDFCPDPKEHIYGTGQWSLFHLMRTNLAGWRGEGITKLLQKYHGGHKTDLSYYIPINYTNMP
jgi:hypothetical protein